MMANVDSLTCNFGTLLSKKLSIGIIIREKYQLQLPKAYFAATFLSSKTSKIQDVQDISPLPVPANGFIAELTVTPSNKPDEDTHIIPPVSINTYLL